MVSSILSLICFLSMGKSYADISHFLLPEFGYFPQHGQNPFQIAYQPPTSLGLPSLYGPPASSAYPHPNPAPVSTPAPVAPTTTTTEFTLPEIIENRAARERGAFIPLNSQYLPPEERPHYESPQPPNQGNVYYYPRPTASTTTTTERPSAIVVVDPPEFLPPPNQEPFQTPPGYDYNAPPPPPAPSTPAPAYLPPGLQGEEALIAQQTDGSTPPLRLRVQEMRCLQNQHSGFFRSVLKVDSFIGAVPSVDNDSHDKHCELRLSRSYVVIDIREDHFHKCGVRACGKDLCLRLRFPAIRGMRTGADAILTLHCKTQDRVAVKTHALKMGVANDVQSRSLGTYAHGGSQNPFRTHVELLRKSVNGFTRHLENNGAVQLGEDLLLRAHVISGDGWNYTKLSDVSLQRISPNGEVLNNANLITSHGCLNPSMQSICNQVPTFDPPLGHRLSFKAVMFQGMQSGDELVMSMRITGCLESQDCQISAQECNSANLGRRRRNTADVEVAEAVRNETEISEVSRISFRVLLPDDESLTRDTSEGTENTRGITSFHVIILAGSVGFVALLGGLGVLLIFKLRKYA